MDNPTRDDGHMSNLKQKAERNIAAFLGKLRARREAKGLTQAELGLAVGATANRISDYESLRTEPSAKILYALADALGVEIG